MKQQHSIQSSFVITGGLWLEMERRRESVDPSDDHTSPAPETIINLVKCKCMKERCANNHCKCRKARLTSRDLCDGCSNTGKDCKNKSVDVNDDDRNDEDDDVDDDESECEYISDSDGEFN